MKHHFFLILAFVFVGRLCGQSTDFKPTIPITPPSPQASSLFKFVEVPVSLHNGMANIQIPLHTIKVGNLTIPISLNYHSRGIKVGEIASSVGIGWTLNAGGAISRQVRNVPDDIGWSPFPQIFTDSTYIGYVYNSLLNDPLIDMVPDQFFFSFPGHSGKFLLRPETGKPLIQDFQDIEVTINTNNSRIAGFEVLDELGNKYIFGPAADSETTRDFRYYTQMAVLPNIEFNQDNTWHLVKIVTPNNEEVTFDYRMETAKYWRKSYDTGPAPRNTFDDNAPVPPPFARSYFSEVRAGQHQISQINYPGGKVVFTESDEPRLDVMADTIKGARALDKVEIYDKKDSLVKGYRFSYEFVKSTDLDNQLWYLTGNDPSAQYRMFLKSIRTGKAGDSLPPYQFEYSSVKLPGRFSTSQDVWGYYNGADNGEYLTFYFENDNRRVDTTKAGAGLLKKIIYPTGGSAEFFYEQNKAIEPSFWDDLRMLPNNPTVQKSVNLGILDPVSPNGEYSTVPFTIGEDLSGVVYSSVAIDSYVTEDPNPCDDNTAGDPGCPYTVKITQIDDNGNVIQVWPLNIGNDIASIFGPGKYILTVDPDTGVEIPHLVNGQLEGYGFSVGLRWEETLHDGIVYASGKRIKKIEYRNELGVFQTKRYEYETPSGSTSGRIFGLPGFYAPVRGLFDGGVQAYHTYGSKPGSPLISLQGNNVGYSQVAEYFEKGNLPSQKGQASDGGKIEYRFTNFEDTGEYYEFPYTLPIDNEWLRGKLLLKRYFKNKNNDYILQKSVQNRYRYADYGVIDNPSPLVIYLFSTPNGNPFIVNSFFKSRTRFVLPLAQIADSDGDPTTQSGISLKTYYQTGGTADLHSTTTTHYFRENGTTQTVEETKNYFYDYADHYQTARTESVDSKGNTTTNHIYYPVDVTPQGTLGYYNLSPLDTATIGKLRETHQLAVPVQVEKKVKNSAGVLLASNAQRTLFKGETGGMILPETYQVSKGGGSMEDRLEFHQYDAFGNPLETSTPGGPHTVYVWGHNDQYLICKIENATLLEVANVLGLSTLQLEALNESSLSVLNGLRTNPSLKNALITTYTYEPLVGVTSITDPRERTTTYHYDEFNRLEYIKDEEGNVLKSFEYHHGN